MGIEDISFSFEAVRWLVVTAVGIYAWFVGRQSASQKEVLDLKIRVTQLEAQIKEMPSSRQLHEVSAKLERLDARLEGLADAMAPISRSLERVNDYLLKTK